MTAYDLIGDLHGHHDALCDLLSRLGYLESADWRHPEGRSLIFVGDLVDRGPKVRETVRLVRRLVESGRARCVMANHEYNMLCYHTWVQNGAGGDFLRPHSDRHNRQVAVTLAAFAEFPGEWLDHLEWLKTLPLWLELPGLRVIHACWDQSWIDWLKARLPDARLTPEILYESAQRGSEAWQAIEALLKGWEARLPDGQSYRDAEGLLRTESRLRWWPVTQIARTWADWLVSDALSDLSALPFQQPLPGPLYPDDAPPVFFGHYWLRGQPRLQAPNVCCLDYSIAKGGSLVAYRWNGEQKLEEGKLVAGGARADG